MKRTTELNQNNTNFLLTIIVQVCTNRIKNVMHTNCIALHITPNMANNTQKHGYMEKGTFSIRIGHNKIYVWTHDTYTKVLGCKTRNISPPMYTSIMKLTLIWPKQVL